jgi:subtilisin family serine protease
MAFLLLLVGVETTWAADKEIMLEPSWKSHDSSKEDDLPGVTEIMVTLKPHARTYVYRRYDLGDGKTSEGYEETMSVSEAQKLSKVAGIDLKIKPISLPEKTYILHEEASVNEKELRRLNKIKGAIVINNFQLLSLPYAMSPKEARAICAKLLKHPDVEYADPNGWGYGDRIPNDTLYIPSQWNLQQSAGGANLPSAWDTNIGGSNIVVAVLDSGILSNHADLLGRTVSGYDFVSDPVLAAEGGGRDADPTDPGNWVTQAEVTANPASLGTCVIPAGQTMNPSSWHGTHVAGIVGANSNNSIGVAGVNWISKILPVRIFGKCGKGLPGDLTSAIQWAAGIPSVIPPTNLNPAKVINISFGGSGACPPTMQSAINAVVKKNVVIVAAAGNDGALASNHWPANCANVITVGAVTRQGGQSTFTNTGAAVSLSAAGGENTLNPLLHKINRRQRHDHRAQRQCLHQFNWH